MPKSRALKEEAMPMMKKDTPMSMMNEAKDMMTSAKNSMMRADIMVAGAKAMMGKKKQQHLDKDEMMEYSDLGGLNFDPKKMKKGKK